MTKKTKWLLLLGIISPILLVVTGCASIMSGGDQDMVISSSPDGAEVRIFDSARMEIWSSKTPASVTLDRGDGYFSGARYTIEVTKPGYEKKVISVKSKLNGGWYLAGNLLLGGWVGWLIVDPLTGAMWKLSPKDVSVNLTEEEKAAFGADGEGFTVVLREEIDPILFDRLPVKRIN